MGKNIIALTREEVSPLLIEIDPKKMGEYEKMKKRYRMLGLPISEVPQLNPSGNMSESYFAHPIKE